MACTKSIPAAVSPSACTFSLLVILMVIAAHGVYSTIMTCEELPVEVCAFSVSSSGNRCVLEKVLMIEGSMQFQCQLSVVMAEKLAEWIETEECINACGLKPMAVGMSTDSLLEPQFSGKLCSSHCRDNCPNIVDLYVNLAAGEGISLPRMCESQKSRTRFLIGVESGHFPNPQQHNVDYSVEAADGGRQSIKAGSPPRTNPDNHVPSPNAHSSTGGLGTKRVP